MFDSRILIPKELTFVPMIKDFKEPVIFDDNKKQFHLMAKAR